MNIAQYWIGQIPTRPISIDVRDSFGRVTNLSSFTDFKVRMLGSNNEEIDLEGSTLNTAGAATGRFSFRFPQTHSVFARPGEYLMQLEFSAPGREFTTALTIKVQKLGEIS